MEYLRLLDIYMRMTLNLTILLFWAATLDPLLIGPLSSSGVVLTFAFSFCFLVFQQTHVKSLMVSGGSLPIRSLKQI